MTMRGKWVISCQMILFVCAAGLAAFEQHGWAIAFVFIAFLAAEADDDEYGCACDDSDDEERCWRELVAERLTEWQQEQEA